MVDNRITDGKRIAQFLSSELTGLHGGILSRVTVVDAEPAVEPSADGSRAYQIALDESPIATVLVYPERAEVRLSEARVWQGEAGNGVRIDESTLTIESAAAVKRAVDCLRTTLESTSV